MLVKRGKTYYSRIWHSGKLYMASLRTKDKSLATTLDAQRKTELVSGRFEVERNCPTLRQFEQQFMTHVRASCTPRTISFYQEQYDVLLKSNLADLRLSQIDIAAVDGFKQWRRAQKPNGHNIAVATTNHAVRTLRRILHLAEQWNFIRKCPKIVLLQGEHAREFVITDEILSCMLVHEDCTLLLKRLVPFLIDTGLRLSEALTLDWVRIGLEPKPGAELGWLYVDKGKSKYAKRHVPLTQRAHSILETIKKEQRGRAFYVFTQKNDSSLCLSRHWVSEQFRTLRDSLRLPQDCTLHSCRHTFCSRLGESGASAFDIQRLAGHGSITMSQRYTHPTPEHLESAVAKMEKAFAAPKSEDEEITAEIVAELKKGKK